MEEKKTRFSLFAPIEMTSGNLFLKMGLFALPIALTTVMQLLYTTVDLITVHYGDSAESMGAIASNSALINLIIVVFANIALGANVVLAQARGEGDREKAEKVLHTSLIFALISGVAVGVLGFFISDDLLRLMKTEEHYLAKAALYLKIYFAGLPFLMLYNYEAQLLRAQGDSQTPFFVLAIAGLFNIGADYLFVFALKMGVAGVGWATVISEGVSALLCFLSLKFSKRHYVSFFFHKLKIDGKVLGEVIKIGLPAGLQGFFFSLPNVFIQSSLYSIDPGNVQLENGAIASGNIEGYLYAGVDGFTGATMSFIAQNAGAKKAKNIKKVLGFGLIWTAIYWLASSLVIGLAYRELLSLFVDTEEAIESGRTRLFIMGFTYVLDGTMLVTAGALRGLRHSAIPMLSTLIFCTLFRIVMIKTVFNIELFHTLFWLYALFPISWVLATLSNTGALLYFLPKECKRIEEEAKQVPVDPTQA